MFLRKPFLSGNMCSRHSFKKLKLALARQSSYGGPLPDASVFELTAAVNGLPEFLWRPVVPCSKLLPHIRGTSSLRRDHGTFHLHKPCLASLYVEITTRN